MKSDCKYDIKGFAYELGLPLNEVALLYSEFIKELNSEMSELKKLLIKKDWIAIKAILHNIKGISANFRITDMYIQTEHVYTALTTSSHVSLESLLKNLFIISEDAIKEITSFFQEEGLSI